MKTQIWRIAVGWALLALVMVGSASSDELGDRAGPLTIEKWVKGGPVALAEGRGETIYVVEFWATWCGPCRTSIPHLSELQEKYKDANVVIVGVSDEDAATVEPFVAEMGSKMSYTVAIDTSRRTHDAYMRAFGQNSIPTAFVVDREGKIAWVGHPMSGLDRVLQEVIDGTYDIEASRRAMGAAQSLNRYFELAMSESASKAKAIGEKIATDGAGDAQLMNEFAWNILTAPGLRVRDLELAMKAAKAAYDASGGLDPAIVDTYARAFYETGDLDRAIEYQRKAVELAQNGAIRGELEKTLSQYTSERGE